MMQAAPIESGSSQRRTILLSDERAFSISEQGFFKNESMFSIYAYWSPLDLFAADNKSDDKFVLSKLLKFDEMYWFCSLVSSPPIITTFWTPRS